ncbi:MAG: 4-(cytidine 5'-diphospho)-2-C-methyl-D-erythritol kinase [Bacteroidota bacterium]
MVTFPNCKINLGLYVVNKRSDGYHNIETVFYPVGWCDVLEVLENTAGNEPFTMSASGITITGNPEQNLIYKAWKLMSDLKRIPPIKVHLHKNIPMGAGLGGGSSDAAHFINLVSKQFDLGFTEDEKTNLASALGSDCAFFIKNRPVLAKGKGNQFSDIRVDLSAFYILLVYPGIHSDTKVAYEGLIPAKPEGDLNKLIESGVIKNWKTDLLNDFEPSLFKKYPQIKMLKQKLYDQGALYASMSGSGSTVFGIFEKEPVPDFPPSFHCFLQKPGIKIL